MATNIDKLTEQISTLRNKISEADAAYKSLEKSLSSGIKSSSQIGETIADMNRLIAKTDELNKKLSAKSEARSKLIDQSAFDDLKKLQLAVDNLFRSVNTDKQNLKLFSSDDAQYKKLVSQIETATGLMKKFKDSQEFKTRFQTAQQNSADRDVEGYPGSQTFSNQWMSSQMRGVKSDIRKSAEQAAMSALKDALALPENLQDPTKSFVGTSSGKYHSDLVARGGDPNNAGPTTPLRVGSGMTRAQQEILGDKMLLDYEKQIADEILKINKRTSAAKLSEQKKANAEAAKEAKRAREERIAQEREAASLVGGLSTQGYKPYGGTAIPKTYVTDVAQAQDLAAKQNKQFDTTNAQKKLQEALQTEAKVHFQAALKYAEAAGFAVTDLKEIFRARRDGPARLTFQNQDKQTGATNKMQLVQDQYENIAPQVPRNLQTFTQGVTKDIRELAKWSIAMAVIYGPLTKINDLVVSLITNEAALADATIAVSSETADASQIFDMVATAADRAGEGVTGVIDAFGQAFRAAGRFSDEGTRLSLTVKLMNDALTLSKLSSLDQAGAIDTLTAALYQSNRPLDAGTSLLDEWVRVSKIANVDIATLATGVAVLGDSAETAGLSVEQLNATIATIAETSLAGGKEAANIAKALIGNYQSDSAVKELNRLGIAITDSTGKTREFLDVMQSVYALRSQGIISNDQFSRLTLALGGGGIRRQKDVSAFIENFGRVQQITDLQANSQGEAAAALAKKLDTLQTSITKFDNALQSFAMTMGDEGGLLDLFKGLVNFGTILVTIIDKITAGMGKAAPIMYTLGIAALALKDKGGLVGLASTIGGFVGNTAFPPTAGREGVLNYSSRNQALSSGVTGLLGNRNLQSALGVGAIVGGDLMEGKKTEAIGAAIGGAIGFALTGGSPIGAIIGASIADNFVSKTMTYETTLANFFAGVIDDSTGGVGGGSKNKTPEQLMSEAFKSIGWGSTDYGQLVAKNIQQMSKTGFAMPATGLKAGTGGYATAEAATLAILEKGNAEQVALAKELRSVMALTGESYPGQVTKFQNRQAEISTPETVTMLEGMANEEKKRLLQQLTRGEIKPTDYSSKTDDISAFSIQATKFMVAFGDEFKKLSPEIDTTKEAYSAFLSIMTSGNQEQINYLNSLISDEEYYQNLIDNWNPANKTAKTKYGELSLQDVQARESLTRQTLAGTAFNMYQGAQLAQNPLPTNVSLGEGAIKGTDLSTLMVSTKKEQEKFYRETSGYNQDQIDEYEKRLDKFSILVEEGGKIFYKVIDGIDQKFFTDTYKKLTESGEIGKASNVGIQQFDVTSSQYKQAEAQYGGLKTRLEGLGYTAKEEKQIVKLTDSDFFADRKDFKLMQLLLGQIADNTKGALDGMYNLPTDASFMVNIAAAIMDAETRAKIAAQAGTGATQYTPKEIFDAREAGVLKWKELMNPDTVAAPSNVTGGFQTPPYSSMPPKVQVNPAEPPRPYQPDYAGGIDFASKLAQMLQNIFFGSTQGGQPGIGSRSKPDDFRGLSGSQAAAQVNTKFDISFQSTTQLMVDGRILATIIKPYLSSDLVQTQQSQSTITRRYVI
jgi:TP901 family phage tail tape measure protein